MKSNAKARHPIYKFVSLVNTRFNTKIKIIKLGNGLEFHMSSFDDDLGIISYVETPQQNYVV